MQIKKASVILSSGMAVPPKVLTNYDLEKMVDTSDEWIIERTGIKERHILDNNEVISTYAIEASKEALKRAGLQAKDIDLIICATLTPDYLMPSLSILIQNGLGAVKAGAFDLSATCSGFLYALCIGDQFVRNNPERKILIVGAEALSRKTNWQDRTTCVLFGDGAGAVIMTGQENHDRGIIDFILGADGSNSHLLTLKGGGSAYFPLDEKLPPEEYYIRMQGREVFKIATRVMEKIALELLERNNLKPEDLDLIIPHQANLRIIEYLRERLNLPKEKFFVNIDRYGNTSAASIPIALYEAEKEGKLQRGNLLLMVAFGGGFTYAGVLMRW